MHSSLALPRRHLHRFFALRSQSLRATSGLLSHCTRFSITRAHSTSTSSIVSLKPAAQKLSSSRQLSLKQPLSLNSTHTRGTILHSSVSTLLLAALAAGVIFSAYYSRKRGGTAHSSTPQDFTLSPEDLAIMTGEIAPGRPGNLTPEQEEKLKQMWKLIFQVCQVGAEPTPAAPADAASSDKAAEEDPKKAKKHSRMSIFSRSKSNKSSEDSSASTTAATAAAAGAPPNAPVFHIKDGETDKYGQTKQFYETLASQSPESIRDTIWSMVKHDHPDALVLRFLRARKWDVEKAVIMLVATMNWRATEMKVDEDIMRNGEGWAVEAEKDASDPAKQRLAHDFLAQIRKGISYVHGCDKQGRPLCIVNARMHKQGEQTEESLERYTVYLIETCRMLLQPPVDTAVSFF